jgi:nucleotide-binding universal stress UspA family protein/uncharacterized ParB-like nuclease family protein
MSEMRINQLSGAVDDFRRLRRQADMERVLAAMRGGSADLLPFDDVRERLRATQSGGRRLQDIPLDAIVGSVGRYSDFSRSFLPRNDKDAERWARVAIATSDLKGLPPIDVYQIDNAYFVLDGNHRVSVARQNGATTIQAYVTPFHSRVKLSPNVTPEELIISAEEVDFLDKTQLDETCPDADLRVTAAGQYAALLEHIKVHQYYMEQKQGRAVSLAEAAADWYKTSYLPLAELIRERGLLRDFPGRSEADLYLFLTAHRAEMAAQLGWDITDEQAARNLKTSTVTGVVGNLIEVIVPDEFESGPPAGQWRREQQLPRRDDRLVDAILVPINGEAIGWDALDQAIALVRRDGGRLYGLHVVPTAERKNNAAAHALQQEFEQRCTAAGVSGQLAIEVGQVARIIVERSRWVDLVVLRVAYAPAPQPLARLKSGLRTLIRRSLRPVLAVPRAVPQFERLLLAYDGSPKAQEALAVATYLAARFNQPLNVLAADTSSAAAEPLLEQAREYLEEHGVVANLIQADGRKGVGKIITEVARQANADLVVMGGYGPNPMQDLMLGSAVEEVLRNSRVPTLICQ